MTAQHTTSSPPFTHTLCACHVRHCENSMHCAANKNYLGWTLTGQTHITQVRVWKGVGRRGQCAHSKQSWTKSGGVVGLGLGKVSTGSVVVLMPAFSFWEINIVSNRSLSLSSKCPDRSGWALYTIGVCVCIENDAGFPTRTHTLAPHASGTTHIRHSRVWWVSRISCARSQLKYIC